jgi:hypothetical protein
MTIAVNQAKKSAKHFMLQLEDVGFIGKVI